MPSPLVQLAALNQAAFDAGVFDWQMEDATYTNPNGITVSFHVIDSAIFPVEQYVSGEVNSFNLLANTFGIDFGDPNKLLFNTNLAIKHLREGIKRKHALNRIPFANYDQPVDLGMGSQRLSFSLIFSGTQYLTAMLNLVQCLFNNATPGLGTLNHPFYQTIKNVLPIEFYLTYENESLNCVMCELVILTSDITHLSPANIKPSLLAEIGKWYIGIENSILSIGGTISAINVLSSNFVGAL